ncbi:HIT family protein [Methanococcoides sp. SA1]|nr:HIT family protein [Methanococcoides sp. SA1]
MEECIFCEIAKGGDFLAESENFFVIRDKFPKVEGHSLVISKKHFGDFMEMDSSLGCEMMELVKEFVGKERWSDFNLVTNNGARAGQIVPHLHWHVLPRFEGDGFEFGL